MEILQNLRAIEQGDPAGDRGAGGDASDEPDPISTQRARPRNTSNDRLRRITSSRSGGRLLPRRLPATVVTLSNHQATSFFRPFSLWVSTTTRNTGRSVCPFDSDRPRIESRGREGVVLNDHHRPGACLA